MISSTDTPGQQDQTVAAANPQITKLISIGKSINGQDIVALKLSKDARRTRDGSKPSVLYLGAQHAREWITPEMIRRLARYFINGSAKDATIKRLLANNELWFVPVANPDGYDFTFEPGQRLWRKNLRDNNGDGQISGDDDGVDPNRNFQTKWGYDNEGSSDEPSSETYRGTGPASEPETRALDAFMRRMRFDFLVNYHSAAELLLYGTGWQVATPTPDDVIYEAMAGDDADPAVPGYDPDISGELYTTNGDTDTHMTARYGTLGFTPEMSTCEVVSDSVPDDPWEADDCGSGFEFPDDEGLVQAEFAKNIPFALSVAKSAEDPDDPVSAVGRTAENFRVDSFDVSYGDPQTVAVVAKRALRGVRLHYRVDGGRTQTVRVSEWKGGERYGDENDDYYAELRGRVRGADPGDDVKVWFSGKTWRRIVYSDAFTYTVKRDTRARVLVIADEDYTGVNPDYPAGTNAPKYGPGGRGGQPARRGGCVPDDERCSARRRVPAIRQPPRRGLPARRPPVRADRGRALRRRSARRRVVHAALQDGGPVVGDERAAPVPALAERRSGLRPRHRGGPYRRPGQLDDAAGPQWRDDDGRPGRM